MGKPLDTHKPKAKKKVVIFEADKALVVRLDTAAKQTGVSRSWLIRAVLGGWISEHGADMRGGAEL
jgi:hypothetical protein